MNAKLKLKENIMIKIKNAKIVILLVNIVMEQQ